MIAFVLILMSILESGLWAAGSLLLWSSSSSSRMSVRLEMTDVRWNSSVSRSEIPSISNHSNVPVFRPGGDHSRKTTISIIIVNMTEVWSAVQTQNQSIATQLDSTELNSTENREERVNKTSPCLWALRFGKSASLLRCVDQPASPPDARLLPRTPTRRSSEPTNGRAALRWPRPSVKPIGRSDATAVKIFPVDSFVFVFVSLVWCHPVNTADWLPWAGQSACGHFLKGPYPCFFACFNPLSLINQFPKEFEISEHVLPDNQLFLFTSTHFKLLLIKSP